MTDALAFLTEALSRVINGGDIGEAELDAAVPNPLGLASQEEKQAWEELSHWADDDDIREKDDRYGAHQRDRMRDCLSKLTALGRPRR